MAMASSPFIVTVGIDFGTFSSTFAYCNNCDVNSEIVTNDTWSEQRGVFKTDTVLQYDDLLNIVTWGIIPKPEKKKKNNPVRSSSVMVNTRTSKTWGPESNRISRTTSTSMLPESRQMILASLFKIHLANVLEEDKPPLPVGLDYRKCVSDYFSELTKLIKNTISTRWPGVNFYRDVKFIFTVPLDFSEGAKDIVRYCVSLAGLVESASSSNLEFILEPTAAALYCINSLRQPRLNPNANFMLVDIGGGTVLAVIYKFIGDSKKCELVEYSSNLCGSTYIDKEFIRYLCENFDLYDALQQLQIHNYDQIQYLAQEFCKKAKLPFTGDSSTFKPVNIDLEDCCPAIIKYTTGDVRERMIDAEWVIELNYDDVKAMFDPVIQRIISHIGNHLSTSRCKCDAMFLVGGGSENQYIQDQIKMAFNQHFLMIGSPKQPITAVVRGAVQYELEKSRRVSSLSSASSTSSLSRGSIQYGLPPQMMTPSNIPPVQPVNNMQNLNMSYIPPAQQNIQNFQNNLLNNNLSNNFVKNPNIPNEDHLYGLENQMQQMTVSQEINPFTHPFKPGSRELKYTYGVQVVMKWKKGDPPERRTETGLMNVFYTLIKANTVVKVGQSVGYVARPSDPNQRDMTFNIYVSPEKNPKFCDEPGMKHYGTLRVDLSDVQNGKKRLVEFSLVFGISDVKAVAKNKKTGTVYQTTLSR
ncbi:actin-like ATPase domain-containing protein [Gigaspora margarita]|uniref:Actin-like ATPase domain-containing protein n=1 Tax=Gigaspora margarita TaxID=4874 RepID=A0A8H4A930_GIGMA|nr:actin-like ATPase domain-containing protein [Gigaspora margarita]